MNAFEQLFSLIALGLFGFALAVWRQPAPTLQARWTRAGLTGGLLVLAGLVAQLAQH